jgi:hypothetical protein
MNLDNMFLQMKMARSKGKTPRRNNVNDLDICVNCGVKGRIVELDGMRVCTACGFVNPGLVEAEQGIKNNKQNGNGFQMGARVVQVHNKNNKIHTHVYSQKLYTLIYPYRNTDKSILGEIHQNVIQLSKKKQVGLQGMDMYVIIGIFMECALIKNRVPIIRAKLIGHIKNANNSDPKRKTKSLEQIHKRYNEYRGMKEIRSIIQECVDHQPTVGELTKYLMNDLKFSDEARDKVSKLVALLSPKNNNNNIPNRIANKSNSEVAAFIVFVVASQQNILWRIDPNAHKAKKIYGVSTSVITTMYKALLQMKSPFALKPVSELFKSKQQSPEKPTPQKSSPKKPIPQKSSPKKPIPQKQNNIKKFIIQIGDKKRRCITYPKPVIRSEAIARGISKDIVNDNKMTKESLCTLLKQHQLAGA